MYKFLSKYHKVILTFLKLLISFVAVYYLWHHRYLQNLWHGYAEFWSIRFVIILLMFSMLNWFFEIKKWQFLAGEIQNISYIEGAKQSLVSFALSLLTPNRVGEYGVKVLFYEKKDYKSVLGLTLIGNVSQFFITLLAGLLGLLFAYYCGFLKNLVYFNSFSGHYWQFIMMLTIGLLIIGAIFYLLKKYRQNPVFQSKLWAKSNVYALLRYIIFSTQFVWLLLYFKIDYGLFTLYAAVSLVYLFATFIPILSFLDWAVKGNVAIWIFSALHVEGVLVFKIVAIMWFFNFFFPFIVGLIWMWRSKTFVR